MARIKFGMMMTDARGKLGGHVFTKARSGATVRTKVSPTNPQSVAQGVVRSRFASLSQSWSSLDEAQRLSWNALALATGKTNIFGDKYFPSGKNLFVAVNSNVLLAGGTIIVNAPSNITMPAITAFDGAIELDLGNFALLTEVAGAIPANTTAVYLASPPSSAGVYNFSGKHYVFHTISAESDPIPTEVFASYVSKFGSPELGKKISVQVFFINKSTGQTTQRSSVQLFVANS